MATGWVGLGFSTYLLDLDGDVFARAHARGVRNCLELILRRRWSSFSIHLLICCYEMEAICGFADHPERAWGGSLEMRRLVAMFPLVGVMALLSGMGAGCPVSARSGSQASGGVWGGQGVRPGQAGR